MIRDWDDKFADIKDMDMWIIKVIQTRVLIFS